MRDMKHALLYVISFFMSCIAFREVFCDTLRLVTHYVTQKIASS